MLEWANKEWRSAEKKDFTKRVFRSLFEKEWVAMAQNGGSLQEDWWVVDKFLRRASVGTLRRNFLKKVDEKYCVDREQITRLYITVRQKSPFQKIIKKKKGM